MRRASLNQVWDEEPPLIAAQFHILVRGVLLNIKAVLSQHQRKLHATHHGFSFKISLHV